MKNYFRMAVLGGATVLLLTSWAGKSPAQGNLLSNGDFTVYYSTNYGNGSATLPNNWDVNITSPTTSFTKVSDPNDAVNGDELGTEYLNGPCLLLGALLPNQDTVTQNLPTVPGQQYILDFWAYAPSGGTSLSYVWDANLVQVFDTTYMSSNPSANNWVEFNFTQTASGNTTVFGFSGGSDGSFLGVDSASVKPVPEPRTLSLLGLGGAGALIFGLGKRSKHS